MNAAVTSMLTPIKKVSISSFAVEAIVRDIGLLHNVYFDQSNFVENEAKYFIKEFEGKRGDRDMLCLRQCAELLGSTNALIDSASILGNKFLDDFNSKVQGISEVITLQMPKEKLHHEQRIMERRLQVVHEDEERRVAEEQAQQHRIVVDHNYHLHAQLFRDKYYIPEPAPAQTTSATSATSAQATSATSATPAQTTSSAPAVQTTNESFSETDAEAAQVPVEVNATSSEFLMFAR
eukprot:Phypoly_transcript_16007.p1 GENE.Phypoly_transcript_16007~~Phypoly_transcript_16007.p1  ORF type:complete len:273 (+),score=74.27 Phypoly_transcript_16007:114-821(+)